MSDSESVMSVSDVSDVSEIAELVTQLQSIQQLHTDAIVKFESIQEQIATKDTIYILYKNKTYTFDEMLDELYDSALNGGDFSELILDALQHTTFV